MNKRKGLTYLEVLIAIVVVSMVLYAMLTGVSFATKYARHNANKTMALNYGQALMEQLKDVSYAELEDFDEYGDSVFLYQAEGANIQADRTVEIDDDLEEDDDDGFDDGESIRMIEVAVSWDWQGKEYAEVLHTLRYDY